MESLKDIPQASSSSELPEVTKCPWINTKGFKMGKPCGKTVVGGRYCSTHKECNPDLQENFIKREDVDDNASEVSDRIQKLLIDEKTTVEFVIKRKNVRIVIE